VLPVGGKEGGLNLEIQEGVIVSGVISLYPGSGEPRFPMPGKTTKKPYLLMGGERGPSVETKVKMKEAG